ncbi:dTDP-4-dehydrorhamnose reductase [Dissulfurirhabdus thermomarina]|uniref:dTDP-4-dehydrorhamnose reductase n=1 Tax=Dissulfurirhabdus thermomarina TaxID=1765737 RepID=A0A6N9TQ44_DISTH|nr:dTDP-4-dehydrorhamnose reductase [Dissulfurirhabdus thermomarina]
MLVTGAGGMLGRDVVERFRRHADVVPRLRSELDVSSPQACIRGLKDVRPDVVVNCAAFTRVDDCETERGAAYLVNAKGPGHLAWACRECGTRLVHMSTDYVFDGQGRQPYRETDATRPVNVYGASKLAGEQAIQSMGGDYLIVRTAWLYGRHGPNFVRTILRLAEEKEILHVVSDQRGSPTYTPDLALGLWWLVAQGARGIVHVTNEGTCTWYEFAREIFRLTGRDPDRVRPVATRDYPRPARRPAYSVLDTSFFAALTGGRLRRWNEALVDYLEAEGLPASDGEGEGAADPLAAG